MWGPRAQAREACAVPVPSDRRANAGFSARMGHQHPAPVWRVPDCFRRCSETHLLWSCSEGSSVLARLVRLAQIGRDLPDGLTLLSAAIFPGRVDRTPGAPLAAAHRSVAVSLPS